MEVKAEVCWSYCDGAYRILVVDVYMYHCLIEENFIKTLLMH